MTDDLLKKSILFIGGDEMETTTRLRTVQIAKHLNCEYTVNSKLTPEILEGKKIFILNKAFQVDRNYLRTLGKVIVDILDPVGIPTDVDGYIVSSHFAKKILNLAKPTFVIYQHHLNFSNIPNQLAEVPSKVSFIGYPHWYPKNLLPPHTAYLEMHGNNIDREKYVTNAYRNTDILLNFRNPQIEKNYTKRHLILNGGMKLINAMAFGIPSISAREPVFEEVGPECTIFSTFEKCPEDLYLLLNDKELYTTLRNKCIARASQYSLEEVSKRFIDVFEYFLNTSTS